MRHVHSSNRFRAAALLAGVLLLAGACAHADHERHGTADPDVRLAGVLQRMDDARAKGLNNGAILRDESVIVDSGSIRNDLERLAFEFPDHVPTLVVCAHTCWQAGEVEKASAYADRVLDLQPENNFAAIVRAQCALKDGNVALARKIVERQIPITPQSPYLHEVHASVCYHSGDLPGALKSLGAAERLGSEKWRLAYLRGLIAEKSGNLSEARKQYQTAHDLMPTFEMASARLAVLPPTGPVVPAAPR